MRNFKLYRDVVNALAVERICAA